MGRSKRERLSSTHTNVKEWQTQSIMGANACCYKSIDRFAVDETKRRRLMLDELLRDG
jgi:hypothetical protein